MSILVALSLLVAAASASVSVSIGTSTIQQCQTVQVTVTGGQGPYVVDATRLANDKSGAIGLVNLPGSNFFQDSCSDVDWQCPISAGSSFRIRAIDANGQWGWSQNICVSGGGNSQCAPLVKGSPGGNCAETLQSEEPCDTTPMSTQMITVYTPPTTEPCETSDTTTSTETPCETANGPPRLPNNPEIPASIPQSQTQPGLTVPDCTVEECGGEASILLLPLRAALFLYEELLFETVFACSLAYWALL